MLCRYVLDRAWRSPAQKHTGDSTGYALPRTRQPKSLRPVGASRQRGGEVPRGTGSASQAQESQRREVEAARAQAVADTEAAAVEPADEILESRSTEDAATVQVAHQIAPVVGGAAGATSARGRPDGVETGAGSNGSRS